MGESVGPVFGTCIFISARSAAQNKDLRNTSNKPKIRCQKAFLAWRLLLDHKALFSNTSFQNRAKSCKIFTWQCKSHPFSRYTDPWDKGQVNMSQINSRKPEEKTEMNRFEKELPALCNSLMTTLLPSVSKRCGRGLSELSACWRCHWTSTSGICLNSAANLRFCCASNAKAAIDWQCQHA